MLFGLGSILLWVLLFFRADRRAPTNIQPIRVALGILLFCVGVSYILAMSRPMSPEEISPADVAVLALASWSGTLLLTHDGIYERPRLDTLIWRLTVCGGGIAALGIVQFLTRELWVDRLSIPGLASSPAYGIVSRGGFPRPAGTSIHPIEYGVLLSMMLPLALHVGLYQTHRWHVIRWLPAGALVTIIPLTSSRSAYIGAVIALIICMIGWPRARRVRALGIGIAGLIAMMAIKPNFLSSVVGLFSGAGDDPSITSRTDSFSLAAEFIAMHPWFGRGLGTFLPKYRILDNQYLLLLVTIGIVGMVSFLALGVTAVISTLRLRKRLHNEAGRDLSLALCASVCAAMGCLFTFDAFAFPMTMGALMLIIGIAGALRRIELSRDYLQGGEENGSRTGGRGGGGRHL